MRKFSCLLTLIISVFGCKARLPGSRTLAQNQQQSQGLTYNFKIDVGNLDSVQLHKSVQGVQDPNPLTLKKSASDSRGTQWVLTQGNHTLMLYLEATLMRGLFYDRAIPQPGQPEQAGVSLPCGRDGIDTYTCSENFAVSTPVNAKPKEDQKPCDATSVAMCEGKNVGDACGPENLSQCEYQTYGAPNTQCVCYGEVKGVGDSEYQKFPVAP